MSLKNTAYKLLDFATLGRGVKRHIRGFDIRLPVKYRGYFWRDYKESNLNFLKEHVRNGNVVIDIGAYLGIFSIRAGQLVGSTGKVFAFEPASKTFPDLVKIIELNKLETIAEPFKQAVSDKEGIAYFNETEIDADFANSLVEYEQHGRVHKTEVKTTSLDVFVKQNRLRALDFFKD